MSERRSYQIERHAKYDGKPVLRFGIIQTQSGGGGQAWAAGTNYVTIQPCRRNTGTPTGEPNVNVYVSDPVSKAAQSFSGAVSDIVAWIPQAMKIDLVDPGIQKSGMIMPLPGTSPNVVVKIYSKLTPDPTGGKYNGYIMNGLLVDNGTGDLTMPDGLSVGDSCLIINLDEQGQEGSASQPTHWAVVGASNSKYASGFWNGEMSGETPARPIVYIDRATYRISSPQALASSPKCTSPTATDTWQRDVVTAGSNYGDTPYQRTYLTGVNVTASTGSFGLIIISLTTRTRTDTIAADGRIQYTSAETQT